MKRVSLLTTALCFVLLVSCSPRPGEPGAPPEQMDPLSPVREAMADGGNLCAVTYVGYALDTLAADFSPDAVGELYSWAEKAPYVDASGDDVFVLIPAAEDCRLQIQEAQLSDGGELTAGAVLYTGDGSPVILRCNVSDIIPNTIVTVTGAGGGELSFSPVISLKDGSVFAPGALDITDYSEGIPTQD